MRYRRVSYRYSMTLKTSQPQALGDPWPAGKTAVVLAQPHWRPPADICESATSISVTIELAGVEPDEVDVLLYEDAVVVEGSRHLPRADNCVFHAVEIRQGPFRLEISLPSAIDVDNVTARYDRGLLHLSLSRLAQR